MVSPGVETHSRECFAELRRWYPRAGIEPATYRLEGEFVGGPAKKPARVGIFGHARNHEHQPPLASEQLSMDVIVSQTQSSFRLVW